MAADIRGIILSEETHGLVMTSDLIRKGSKGKHN
jgi:hypothetical protein